MYSPNKQVGIVDPALATQPQPAQQAAAQPAQQIVAQPAQQIPQAVQQPVQQNQIIPSPINPNDLGNFKPQDVLAAGTRFGQQQVPGTFDRSLNAQNLT